MGFLDFLILGVTGFILIISLFLLILSLRTTEDKIRKQSYKKTYIPVITLCVMVLVAYAVVVRLGSLLI